MTITLDTTPRDCVTAMTSAVLGLAPFSIAIAWAELTDNVGVWAPEDRTLRLNLRSPLLDQASCLEEFHQLCLGNGQGHWQDSRPPLRLVTSHGRNLA